MVVGLLQAHSVLWVDQQFEKRVFVQYQPDRGVREYKTVRSLLLRTTDSKQALIIDIFLHSDPTPKRFLRELIGIDRQIPPTPYVPHDDDIPEHEGPPLLTLPHPGTANLEQTFFSVDIIALNSVKLEPLHQAHLTVDHDS